TAEIGDLTFGYVNLNLIGSITGDKVTVISYGDGVIGEFELDLDQEKGFSQDIVTNFSIQKIVFIKNLVLCSLFIVEIVLL
ncbi:MAG: hypothetical protein U9N08_01805, partial [Candidatus Caldatribacteriota bacterium]|nr:hypothetical protein [Candidatus Caldatribacteriota bacterium]